MEKGRGRSEKGKKKEKKMTDVLVIVPLLAVISVLLIIGSILISESYEE